MTTSPAPRRRLGVDERRALLLELGLRLFGHRGVDDVAVEDIARAGGVSAGLLYHYFGSKREFHYAVTAYACDRLAAVTAPDAALPPGAQLVRGLVAYLDHLRAEPTGWAWLLRGGGGSTEQHWQLGAQLRRTSAERVLAVLPAHVRTPMVVLAVKGWVGSTAEVALAWLESMQPPAPAVVALMADVLLASLTAAGVPDPLVAELRRQADTERRRCDAGR